MSLENRLQDANRRMKTASDPVKSGHVQEALAQHETVLIEMGDLLHELHRRVSPVLIPQPADAADGCCPTEQVYASELETEINRLTDRVGEINSRIRYILGALRI